jgi:soluble lytic murein transglycosylase-like protein
MFLRQSAFYRVIVSLLVLVLFSTVHLSARADVWKYVDENGVTHFTNQPPAKGTQLVIQSNPDAQSKTVTSANDSKGDTDASAHRAVAMIHASPTYQAVQGNLTAASTSYGVDFELLKAVVSAESAFNPLAVSNKGAVGLMQIMPATARRYGVQSEPGLTISSKLTDPELNIRTGARYLSDLLRLFAGETELAVAAYNAGEGAVMRAGNRIPNYKETQNYVKKVMAIYRVLQIR